MPFRSEVMGLVTCLAIGAAAVGNIGCSKDSNKVTNPGPSGGVELDSGTIPPGGVFVHTFNSAGSFPYHCAIHPVMTGNSVTVSAGSTVDSVLVNIVSTSAPGFSPSATTIKVGGRVRWMNTQGSAHTVTSGN